MRVETIERVAEALLYEGYLLYPYRASSVKNRQRWTFGVLYPEAWCREKKNGDASSMQTQCLVRGAATRVEVRVRFLEIAPSEEATRRDVVLPAASIAEIARGRLETPFAFGELGGSVELRAESLSSDLHRLTVRVRNTTPWSGGGREAVLTRALAAAHTIVTVTGGELVSLVEPPDELRAAASACENVGTWPALVGEPGAKDAILSSPIIVYDYPTIAPESPGDLFDATEIDEILSLRILTLTDEEKAAVRAGDARARALLDRTEALTQDELLKLHGTLRGGLRVGARVRIKPRARADVFDIVLEGKTATVESVEHDMEGRVHVAVAIDDDPGRDLGLDRQVGHRFFFGADEVEVLA
jgi:hypothetical protein